MNINHYAVAIATGLTHEQAKLYDLAKRKSEIDINHLILR